MKFHADFSIKKPGQLVSHTDQLLLIGSCFTASMTVKLCKHKFRAIENPNGILFNPISVSEALDTYLHKRQITGSDIFQYNETWHSWKHHSRFSAVSAEACVNQINESVSFAGAYLKNANHLLITLGSAWVYELTDKAANAIPGSVAANNHKAPADWFSKRLLGADETFTVLETVLQKLLTMNPQIQVIFTISPVRHLREGLVENNRSKSVLIQAVHKLVERYPQFYYFPAYELVIDDLRDYRFYAEDLVHPNYQATQYVWEKFTEACMGDETRALMKEIAEINLAHQHKPFNPSTTHHQKFLGSYLVKTKALQAKYPWLDFSAELAYFENNQ